MDLSGSGQNRAAASCENCKYISDSIEGWECPAERPSASE